MSADKRKGEARRLGLLRKALVRDGLALHQEGGLPRSANRDVQRLVKDGLAKIERTNRYGGNVKMGSKTYQAYFGRHFHASEMIRRSYLVPTAKGRAVLTQGEK